jgi:hypothetical protein
MAVDQLIEDAIIALIIFVQAIVCLNGCW